MGYGLVEGEGNRQRAVAYGCLQTPAGQAQELRLKSLYEGLIQLIDQHKPEALAVEELFFGRNVTTAIHVGQARGIVLLAAANRSLPVREYTPMQVKQAVVGYGKAEKAQVQAMVKMILGLPAAPKPDDVADALAVAICCMQSWHVENRMNGLRGG